MKNIVYMGSSYFALEILKYLVENDYKISALVTQPDKRVGRKKELVFSAIKEFAIENNIVVIQPIAIKDDFQEILNLEPSLILTCAYGQFLPQEIIDYGVINIHASLLPKYRGGAPMHRAIMNGEVETGISLMKSELKMDAGPVCAFGKVEINDNDTVNTLQEKLIKIAKILLSENLDKILNGDIEFIDQDDSLRTLAYIIKSSDELIDFKKPYQEVYDHIRGLIDWPVGYAYIQGKKMKFYDVKKLEGTTNKDSGTIIDFKDDYLRIAVDNKILGVSILQIEGKQKTSAKDFKNGIGRSLIERVFNED